jgi:hypothetical protein
MKPQGHIPASDSPAAHEAADINVSRIVRIVALLGVIVVTSILALLFFFRWAEHSYPARMSEASPTVLDTDLPPQPRLQTDPTRDLQAVHAAEDAHLNHYGWIDRNQGIAQIPVERAMELYVKNPQSALSPATTNAALPNEVTELQMRQQKAQEGAHAP